MATDSINLNESADANAQTGGTVGSVNLSKGHTVNLTKIAKEGLESLAIGLGWDEKDVNGAYEFDLDLSAFAVTENGKVRSADDMLFYGTKAMEPFDSLSILKGALLHTGDDTTGGSSEDGDDEVILVKLGEVDSDIKEIIFVATIHDATARGNQTFAQANRAYIRVVNTTKGAETEMTKYSLGDEFAANTGVKFGSLVRSGSEWEFKAIGAGTNDGLAGFCAQVGLDTN